MAIAQLILPTLHPGQRQIVREARRFNVLCMGRRFGKTTLGIDRMIRPALDGWPVGWFAPEDKFYQEVWTDLLRILKPVITYKNTSKRIIEIAGGGVINVWNMAKPEDVGRGYKYKWVGVDEAARMSDLQNAWEQAISPTLIDYTGTAWIFSCVTAGTRVSTTKGLLPIETLATNRLVRSFTPLQDITVAGFPGDPQSASDAYYNGSTPTYKVRTRAGFTLEGTPNHPVWALHHTEDPEWVNISQLTADSYVAVRRGVNLWGNEDDLTGYYDYVASTPNGKTLRTKHKIPSVMHEDLAYLMGLILGDGYVNYKNGSVVISCATNETDTHTFLTKGSSGLTFKKNPQSPYHWVANSLDFTRFLEWYGFSPGKKSPDKTIPTRLWSASGRTVRSFLSGLFDADGSAHADHGDISFVSTSSALIQGVQQLLLNIGIIGRIRPYTAQPTALVSAISHGFTLTLCAKEADIFYREVGFKLTRKQAQHALLKDTGSARAWRGDGIPKQQQRVSRIRKSRWYQGNVTKDFYNMEKNALISLPLARRFLLATAGDTSTSDWVALEGLSRGDYFWDRVDTLEIGEAETFDLVIPTTHAFLANGIVSHNTPKGYNHFHSLYERGIEADKRIAEAIEQGLPAPVEEWKSWTFPSQMNPHLPASELERMQEELTPKNYSQEILAQFLGEGTAVFPNVMDQALEPLTAPNPSHQYVMGVDWGRDADWTVFTVIDITTKAVSWIEATSTIEFHHQRDRLLALAERYHPLLILTEMNAIGVPNFEELARMGLPVSAFWTTNASKQELVDALVLGLARRQLRLLGIEAFVNNLPVGKTARDQLLAFESSRLPSGNVAYGAPKGTHDDYVISLGLAWLAALAPNKAAFSRADVQQAISDGTVWDV